jgi:hypothetical protein
MLFSDSMLLNIVFHQVCTVKEKEKISKHSPSRYRSASKMINSVTLIYNAVAMFKLMMTCAKRHLCHMPTVPHATCATCHTCATCLLCHMPNVPHATCATCQTSHMCQVQNVPHATRATCHTCHMPYQPSSLIIWCFRFRHLRYRKLF